MTSTRRLAAILAADVVGYSRLMANDEVGTLEALKACRREVVDPAIAEHRGRIVKTTGDGILVEFASAVDAVICAMAVQGKMAERGGELEFRIGINVGDIIIDSDDIFGDGVNIAARVEGECEPGGVYLSAQAFDQVRNKTLFAFDDLGEKALKNIDRPIRIYSVRLETGLPASVASLVPSRPLPIPDKPSIAVLPFQNMSGDPEQEYFADGMVEDIITALSRFKSLFVIARNSSFTYKGKVIDIKQVGRELGVRYVLEGSVRKANGRVRITGQLIEANTNKHLWADRFDGALEDVFDLQDQVTVKVVSAVTPSIERAEIERAQTKPTGDLNAYDYYLRGRAIRVRSPDDNLKAIGLYRRAVELDPEFGRAYASLASALQFRWMQDWADDRPQLVAEGTDYAEKAVARSQDDAEALSLAAFFIAFVKHELDLAERVIDQAIQLNPNLTVVRSVRGWISVWIGRPEEAIPQLEALIRLSPVDVVDLTGAFIALAAAHNHSGRPDIAISWVERALARSPKNIPALTNAIVASVSLGREEEARRYSQRMLAITPETTISRIREVLAFRRPQDMDRMLSSYRKIGIPE